MTISVWHPSGPPKRGEHRVADVHFVHAEPADEAPMDCICGWSGTVGDWDAHRRGERRFGKPSVSRATTELEAFERPAPFREVAPGAVIRRRVRAAA